MRGFDRNFDVRVACRRELGGTEDPFDVDLFLMM